MTHTLTTLLLDVTAGPAGLNMVAVAFYCMVAMVAITVVVERATH